MSQHRQHTRRTALRVLGAGTAAGVVLGLEATVGSTPAAAAPLTLLDQATWGAYAYREPWPNCQAHFDLESALGTRLRVMSWFITWSVSWPNVGGQQAADGRYDIQIAWQPELDDDTPILFSDIVAKKHDAYLTRFFTKAKNHPGRVIVRFAHEMNGNGYPWSVAYQGAEGRCLNSPGEYVAAWRYLVDFKRRMGATNVLFAWCVMTNDKGGIPAEQYYPGNEYVQILSMDVYVGYGGGWQEPGAALSKTYNRLAALSPTKPIWVGEIGCREPTKAEAGAGPDPEHSKVEWLRKLFTLTQFPRITNVMFFHHEKAHDWRLNSTPEALAVCREAFARRVG